MVDNPASSGEPSEDDVGPEPSKLGAIDDLLRVGVGGALSLKSLTAAYGPIVRKLVDLDALRTAATFGGLLLQPDLQSSTLRLECLVHLALIHGNGKRKPPEEAIARSYTAMGKGPCGMFEDAAENVFVDTVATSRGNFRFLAGIWETPGFYLQRLVNMVEGMPSGSFYEQLRDNVFALLKLSDVVCERADLARHQLGGNAPVQVLPRAIRTKLASIRSLTRFNEDTLAEAGIDVAALSPFFFDPRDLPALAEAEVGHSPLERFPIVCDGGDLWLVLPTAISIAIRRLIIEQLHKTGQRKALARGLAREYAQTFGEIRIMGANGRERPHFVLTENGIFAGAILQADLGRYLCLAFYVDTLEGFDETGFSTPADHNDTWLQELDTLVAELCETAMKDPDFKSGIVMIVPCGVGRPEALSFHSSLPTGWRLVEIGAADLETLSGTSEISPLSLWRLLDGEERLSGLGVELQNFNGLLNLFAWSSALGGHLIPHERLPDDFVTEGYSAFVVVDQNGLRTLRHEFLTNRDERVVSWIDGTWRLAQKPGESYFDEELRRPLYFEVRPDPVKRGLASVYLAEQHSWWCEIKTPDETPAKFAAERFKMATAWLQRAAPILDQRFPGLPSGPLLWLSSFTGRIGEYDLASMGGTYEDARAAVTASSDVERRMVTLEVGQPFEAAILNANNVAERALVDGLVEAVADLAGEDLSEVERAAITDEITGGNQARQTHLFLRPSIRDRLMHSLPSNPIFVEKADDASERMGMGWRVRERSLGPMIKGKTECMTFLNAMVTWLEDELCRRLREFDRASLIELALRNHEAAVVDRDRWQRTAGAVLALSDNPQETRAVMTRHDFKLNGVFQATRLLIEIANAECPLEGGRKAGELDLARLMTIPLQLMHIGGWSDAVRWDAMEPEFKVSPLGDIQSRWRFLDAVVQPFAQAASDVRVDDSIDNYAKNLQAPGVVRSVEDQFDPLFVAAWREQTGASIDDFRLFIECMETLAETEDDAVLRAKRSALLEAKTDERLDPEVANTILNFLTLKPRPGWREVPDGFAPRDIHSWRFRRQLSPLRKPLIQIEDAEDATFMLAPGLVRDAFYYMFQNFHRGDFLDEQLSPLMRAWKARVSDQRGSEFNTLVRDRLRELGWEAEKEVQVTRLLRQGFDRNYGDVDVLAWNKAAGRVLAIECKDVQFRKTLGEMAEQLADFRGELKPNGKPDLLRKHLDRMELIQEHLSEVAAFVGMERVSDVESHLVFHNPVPMKFALDHLSERVAVSFLDELARL